MQDYDEFLKKAIEAILFVSEKGVSISELSKILNISEEKALSFMDDLIREYENRGINIYKINGKYEMGTSPMVSSIIAKFLEDKREKLSKPALETLAIIYYHQPITKAEIEELRGVNCDGVINQLLERGLIKIVGRKETIGRPFLYGVTENFYKYFLIEDEKCKL
ncbi:MAG: SMC-Scp complex subunit ScpB [Dictyoglomus sp. NZ13-RE01]|nr:MAG: SMC-Scp complex subunit ScpB [Dictyoglomus sp. NZ13-RE01]